jgi:hypothetical protein
VNDISTLLVPVLIVLPIFDWIATGLLLNLSRAAPDLTFLRERAISAVILSITTTAFALIFLNTSEGGVIFSNDVARLLGRLATLLLALGPLAFLFAYLRGSK